MHVQCTLYIVHDFIRLPTCHKEWLISDYRESGMGMLEEKGKESEKRPQNVKEAQSRLACHAWCCATLLGKTLRDSSYQSLSAL